MDKHPNNWGQHIDNSYSDIVFKCPSLPLALFLLLSFSTTTKSEIFMLHITHLKSLGKAIKGKEVFKCSRVKKTLHNPFFFVVVVVDSIIDVSHFSLFALLHTTPALPQVFPMLVFFD